MIGGDKDANGHWKIVSRSFLAKVCRSQIDHHPVLRADEPRIDQGPLDPMRALLDRRLRQPDEHRLGQSGGRDVHLHLDRQGLDCQLLSGELPQGRRTKVMAKVKAGEVRFLAATDVAARGIDISTVTQGAPNQGGAGTMAIRTV